MSRSTGLLGRMTWMELKLLLREPLTMIFIFGFPLLVPVVLGEVFGNMPDHPNDPAFRGVGPMDYYVPAYIGLAVSAAIVGAVVIAAAGSLMYQVHGPEDLAAVLAGFVLSVACFASIGVLLWGRPPERALRAGHRPDALLRDDDALGHRRTPRGHGRGPPAGR